MTDSQPTAGTYTYVNEDPDPATFDPTHELFRPDDDVHVALTSDTTRTICQRVIARSDRLHLAGDTDTAPAVTCPDCLRGLGRGPDRLTPDLIAEAIAEYGTADLDRTHRPALKVIEDAVMGGESFAVLNALAEFVGSLLTIPDGQVLTSAAWESSVTDYAAQRTLTLVARATRKMGLGAFDDVIVGLVHPDMLHDTVVGLLEFGLAITMDTATIRTGPDPDA